MARASGGVWFYSNADATAGVKLTPGANAWDVVSDRNAKHGFTPVDAQDVLKRVARLPISTWTYNSQPGVRHMGPMAQDFRAGFGLGTDERSISTVDADGVMFAAIQGLNQKIELEKGDIKKELRDVQQQVGQLAAENRKLHEANRELQAVNQELGKRMDRLEAGRPQAPVGALFGKEWGLAAIALGLVGTGLFTARRRTMT